MMIAPKLFSITPLILLFLLALLIGFIILLIKKPKIILPVLLIGLLVFLTMTLSYRSTYVPVARNNPQVHKAATAFVSNKDISMELPDIWKPGIETEFEVSDYTTIEAAAAGLAKKITFEGYLNDAIKDNGPGNMKFLTDIQVCGNITPGIADNMSVLEAAADSFRKYAVPSKDIEQNNTIAESGTEAVPQIEPVKVTVSPAVPSNPLWGAKDGAVLVKISARVDNSEQKDQILTRHGILVMQISANRYQLDNSVAYSEANWLAKPEQYSRDSRSNDTWLVGYSQTACSDPAEARSQAIDDAAKRLAKNFGTKIAFDKSDMSRLNLVKDTYTQKLKGSQGNIYRTAVLASGPTSMISSHLAGLQHSHTEAAVAEQVEIRKSVLSDWASVAILLGAILLSYFLLDFITKGYYKGRLVMVLIAIAVLGFFVIMFLSNRRPVMARSDIGNMHIPGGQITIEHVGD